MLMEHYPAGSEPDFMKSSFYHCDGMKDYMDDEAPPELKAEFEKYVAEREKRENELIRDHFPYLLANN